MPTIIARKKAITLLKARSAASVVVEAGWKDSHGVDEREPLLGMSAIQMQTRAAARTHMDPGIEHMEVVVPSCRPRRLGLLHDTAAFDRPAAQLSQASMQLTLQITLYV